MSSDIGVMILISFIAGAFATLLSCLMVDLVADLLKGKKKPEIDELKEQLALRDQQICDLQNALYEARLTNLMLPEEDDLD